MIIDNLLREAKMSRYKLSKESGVAQATISDICRSQLQRACDREDAVQECLRKAWQHRGRLRGSLSSSHKP